eukprot:2584885-Prymnesium_polylepis.2
MCTFLCFSSQNAICSITSGLREQTARRCPARSCARNWRHWLSRQRAQRLSASVSPHFFFSRRRFTAPMARAAATTVFWHTSDSGGSCFARKALTVKVAWICPMPDSSSSAAIIASASDSLPWRPPPARRPGSKSSPSSWMRSSTWWMHRSAPTGSRSASRMIETVPPRCFHSEGSGSPRLQKISWMAERRRRSSMPFRRFGGFSRSAS